MSEKETPSHPSLALPVAFIHSAVTLIKKSAHRDIKVVRGGAYRPRSPSLLGEIICRSSRDKSINAIPNICRYMHSQLGKLLRVNALTKNYTHSFYVIKETIC